MKASINFDRVDQYGPQTQRESLRLDSSHLQRDELTSRIDARIDVATRKGEMPGEYVVDGNLFYEGELFCARCLEPFPFANRSSFTLRYRPRPANSGTPEAELEVADEELDLDYCDERTVPLENIAQEQVQLSLPMKPLCEEGCQGLCPGCGRNLRRGTCDCAATVGDPRWDSLRGFRAELARKKEN